MKKKLQVGDFVKSAHPAWSDRPDRYGFIVEKVIRKKRQPAYNNIFKVLWTDGQVRAEIWDYDLELVK